MVICDKPLGRRIKELRDERGWCVSDVVDRAILPDGTHVSKGSIEMPEEKPKTRRGTRVGWHIVEALANAFGMTDQQFMEVPDEMDPFYWVIREAIQHQVTPEQLVEFIRKVPR